ncbi:hypothetical protein EDD70_1059 [Hydrogenoanaerobacterium saccharovorans]|uniref:Uncharacterized protein n=1 Tax=Hydrogenoanaerobacterium saccharovorans TaxID=474960 RepID=A0A1H8A322_9FIRM|nr:hypothetical protein EDD70_1059 [Hydrogenoanaerobacterium saccharovorans]SEM64179.1 hypothetical protein SAMN05216180_1032 [Hydrogenoanaerobacterium saccharovorans]
MKNKIRSPSFLKGTLDYIGFIDKQKPVELFNTLSKPIQMRKKQYWICAWVAVQPPLCAST